MDGSTAGPDIGDEEGGGEDDECSDMFDEDEDAVASDNSCFRLFAIIAASAAAADANAIDMAGPAETGRSDAPPSVDGLIPNGFFGRLLAGPGAGCSPWVCFASACC